MTGTRILAWRPHRKGALYGFAKVFFPSGVAIAIEELVETWREQRDDTGEVTR